jgi:hypothetical protein
MVKASDIVTLMERYLSEKRLDNLEALYMWSKGIPPVTIAPVLRNKYGSDVAYSNIVNDLSQLKITRENDSTEDTKESINMAIDDVFRTKCVDIFLDQIRESYKIVSEEGKMLLLALTRSGLFTKGDIKLDELRLAYRSLFNKIPSEFSLNTVLRHLEKIGLLYMERLGYRAEVEQIKIPSYVYAILPEIEAKLPIVEFGSKPKS